ncbi:MAG: hypothetical protein ACP5JG_04450 [Anaerolineae bacterium]
MDPDSPSQSAPVNAIAPGGPIVDWVLLGPFESSLLTERLPDGVSRSGFHRDFLTPLGGEAKAALQPTTTITYAPAPGKLRTISAQRIGPDYEPTDVPDLRHILYHTHVLERDYDQAVAYAFCYLESQRDQVVYAYLGSDGSPKVWLNGDLVHRFWRDLRQTRPWQDRVRLSLKKGLNRLLIKIDNRRGWWGFQIEIYDQTDHARGIEKALRSLAIEDLRVDTGGITMKVRLVPKPFDFSLPVTIEVRDQQGAIVARSRAETGETQRVDLPPDLAGPVTVRAQADEDSPYDLRSPDVLCFVGDMSAAIDAGRRRLDQATADLSWLDPAWRPVYEGLVDWLHSAFEYMRGSDEGVLRTDAWAIRTLGYAADFIEAFEAHRNLVAERPDGAFPVLFEGVDSEGRTHQGVYHVSLPEGYGRDLARRYPLVLELHGSGRVGRRITFEPSTVSRIPPEGEPVILVNPISPHRFWDVDFLNDLMRDLKARLRLDEERTYLEGASGGGKGAWDWGLANPDHFAAMIVLCGNEGYPFRAPRLRTTPVWILNGELDLASYPFLPELMVSAMQRAGCDVRYTLFPDLAHSLSAGYDRADLKAWLLDHRRQPNAPEDPLAALELGEQGISPVEMIEVSSQLCLALAGPEADRYPQDNVYRAAMKLYQVYRKPTGPTPARRADGRVFIRSTGDIDGPARMLLTAPDPTAAEESPRLEPVVLPPMAAARVFVRCDATWEALNEKRASVYAWMAKCGLHRAGEERAIPLTIMDKDGTRFWELQIAVQMELS